MMKIKRRRRLSKMHTFLFSIIILIALTVSSLYFVGNRIWPVIIRYATSDAENVVTEVVNQVLQKEIIDLLNMDNLFVINKDTDGIITMIDFNPQTINEILQKANEVIQAHLIAIENGDVTFLKQSNITLDSELVQKIREGRIALIPMGVALDNVLFANLGPKVPVQIHFMGNVASNITSKVENYGINNALLSSSIHMEINAQIILPLASSPIDISVEIPLSLKMIQGKVPNYYQNGYHSNSSLFAIPFEE